MAVVASTNEELWKVAVTRAIECFILYIIAL